MNLRIDMSPAAVTRRVRLVDQLRRLCLSLADTSAGKDIRKRFGANKLVQRTSQNLGP